MLTWECNEIFIDLFVIWNGKKPANMILIHMSRTFFSLYLQSVSSGILYKCRFKKKK